MNTPRNSLVSLFTFAALIVFGVEALQAASGTWKMKPESGDWNNGANWLPGGAPNGSSDIATFGMSSVTNIFLSANTEVNQVVFNANASPYTITADPMHVLTVSGAGIINSSGAIQNFVADPGGLAGIAFTNNATAGRLTNFTVNGGAASGESGGRVQFNNSSTAGNGVFTVNASVVDDARGGVIVFTDTATAGSGTFTVNGRQDIFSLPPILFNVRSSAGNGTFTIKGGQVFFADDSTAENATLIANGSSSVSGSDYGSIIFNDVASTGSATLIANGGTNGGRGGGLGITDGSGGGNARVEVFGNGGLGVGDNGFTFPVTIGSLEGDGSVQMSASGNPLSVGSNNLSTTFSGAINGARPLIKIGSGTLTLSGANTYTGATTVNAGKLAVDGSIVGAVTVTAGTLAGKGTINGTVTINSGAALLGGDAVTPSGKLTIANNLTLNTNSIVELVLGASGGHSSLMRAGGIWNFAPNQRFTFIDVGTQPGFYNNIITGLASDPGSTSTWTITNLGFSGTFSYDGAGNIDLTLTSASGPALQLLSAVSRKTHGAAGDFDIPLPLTGHPGVECRASDGNYTLVFTFNNDVVSGNPSVVNSMARITSAPVFDKNTMTVTLTKVADAQTLTITLSNVNDSFGQVLPDKMISVNMLTGDTTGDGTVNSSDIVRVKLNAGATVTNSNFRTDISVDGAITSSDISLVKANSGQGLSMARFGVR